MNLEIVTLRQNHDVEDYDLEAETYNVIKYNQNRKNEKIIWI